MKRLLSVWLVFLSVVLVAIMLMSWLIGTNQGARFVVDTAIRSIPANIQTGSVNGKLAGGLEIEDIKVQSQAWEVSVKRLYLRWNPFHLLGGWIGIREISVEDLSVNDLFPDVRSPHDLTWPYAKGFLSWIKARVKLLHITSFIYKEAGLEVQKAERIQAQLTWYLGGLNVRSVLARGTTGIIEGSFGASFTNPKFTVNLQIKPDQPLYDLNVFQFKLNLEHARDPQKISGPVTLIGMSGNNEQVKLSGVAGITKDTISLDKIEFKEMGRPGTINGNGSLNVSLPQRPYELKLVLNNVSISKAEAFATSISGIVMTKGDIAGYEGSFALKNNTKSWKEVSLEGKFQGSVREIKVTTFTGSVLNGVLGGTMKASWEQGIKITGVLEARNLNPAIITPDWPGTVNADLITSLNFSGSDYPEGTVKLNLLKSVVRKRPLNGTIDARWKKEILDISHCELHGNGFDISVRGVLQDKIDYQFTINDLGGLIPHSGGRFLASGWLRWARDQWAGVTKAEGHAISIDWFKVESATLQAQINERGDEIVRGKLQARNLLYGPFNLGSPGMNVEGKLSSHDLIINLIWPKSSGTIVGHGGYKDGLWQGTLSRIEGKDSHAGPFTLVRPVAMRVSGESMSLTPLILTGSTGESVEIASDLVSGPMRGNINIRWEKLNLARANQFLNDVRLDGQSSGSLEAQITDKERLKLNGTGSGVFAVTRGPVTLRVSSNTKLNFDEKGIRVFLQAGFQGGGKLEGQFDSNEAAYLKKPESGSLKIVWNDLDVAVIKPWLPQTIDLKGRLSGAIQGRFLPGSRFELSGDSKMTGSSFTWINEGGIITSSAENASLDFQWKDQGLKGSLDIRFPSHGKVKSAFIIPLPARFPMAIEKTGMVDISANGEIRERGIISSLFPGFIEESKGQFSFEVTRTGTWELADVKGRVRLDNATAYLPSTGTRIKDGTIEATFIQDRIEITSFIAKSGPGKIEGSGTIWIKEFGIDRFKAKLDGERFQAIYLPELQVQANPDLTFEGEGNKVKIRGTIRIPEALLRDSGSKSSVRASQDVVVVDAPQKERKPLRTEVDIQVNVVFGDKVRIQAEGLAGRMEGNVLLTGRTPERILGKGTLKIVNGKFNSYGIKLDVTRGNIIFDNRPVDQASLDIMAIRAFNPGKFDEIKAGVTVTGTPMSPLIKLYSEPPMTDTDVLSYIVLGRPIKAGAESNQTAMLLKSASAVLGTTKAGGIQDQLQQRLGIDTLEVQEQPKSAFISSYRTTTTSSPTLDNSLMTVGKYLSPDLYVSYGRSLFNDQYIVSARYALTKQLELESKAGIATSVDLFYKIDFD
jgi:translocation and assembly module TamB